MIGPPNTQKMSTITQLVRAEAESSRPRASINPTQVYIIFNTLVKSYLVIGLSNKQTSFYYISKAINFFTKMIHFCYNEIARMYFIRECRVDMCIPPAGAWTTLTHFQIKRTQQCASSPCETIINLVQWFRSKWDIYLHALKSNNTLS